MTKILMCALFAVLIALNQAFLLGVIADWVKVGQLFTSTFMMMGAINYLIEDNCRRYRK